MTEHPPKFEACGAIGACMAHPKSYEHDATPRYGSPSAKLTAAYALRALERARAIDVERHERNIPIMADNKVMRERIEALMTEAGIGISYSVYEVPPRGRMRKWVTKTAGYIADVARALPIDDGFVYQTQAYERMKALYESFAKDAEREDERAKAVAAAEEERKRAERRANIELVEIILRYDLDRDLEWPGVLETLRGRDQRLDLAVAMHLTRGDWSEGAYRVESALDSFKIETTEDKDIANDVLSCLREFEDGRVFRDTAWSYGRLFASAADQQLSADVQKALANTQDEL